MAAVACRILACAVLLAACATSHAKTLCQTRFGFTAIVDRDAWGNDIVNSGIKPATQSFINGDIMPTNVLAVEEACNKNPWCMAYNSNGWLKHTYGPLRTSSTVCTYKRTVQDALPPSYTNWVHIGTGTDRRRCVEVNDNNKVNYAPLQQWECVGVPAQEWKTQWAANDTKDNMYYRIKATDSLCVQAGGELNGASLTLATCSANSWRQHFSFVPSSATFTQDGATKRVYGHVIRLRRTTDGLLSNYCLDVTSASTSNGARLQVLLCNGSMAQLFRLAKAYSTLGYNAGH